MALLIVGAVLVLLQLLLNGPATRPERESNFVAQPKPSAKLADANDGDRQTDLEIVQETQPRADDEAPSILVEVDETTKARFKPWFDEYRAQIKGSDPVTDYDFFLFDDVVVQNILSGAATKFRFGLHKHSYEVEFDYSAQYEGGVMIRGHIPDHPTRSWVSIHVSDDGAVALGSLQALGSALLVILPVPDSPYHVVYSKTGTIPVD